MDNLSVKKSKFVEFTKSLSSEDLEKLKKHIKYKILQPYEEFLSYDNVDDEYFDLYMVRDGLLKVYTIGIDGRKVILDMLHSGDLFSKSSFYQDTQHIIEAVEETEVGMMTHNDFIKLGNIYPEIVDAFLSDLAEGMARAYSKIIDIGSCKSSLAILHELLRLKDKFGNKDGEDYIIEHEITHESIGEMLGFTRETVTRVMNKLVKLNYVSYTDKRYVKLNMEKIKHID